MLCRKKIITEAPVNKEYDYLMKFVMVGDPGVGKSSILLRFADDMFNENYYSTIGVDFRFKTLLIDDTYIKLQIWDTAGQEKFRCLTNAYYKGSNAIFLVFDLTNKSSFDNLSEWLDQIHQYVDTNPLIMILGAKSDLTSMQAISNEEIEEFARAKNCPFYLVSAKNNANILESFVDSVRMAINKMPTAKSKQSLLNIGDPYKNKKESFMDDCCQ